MPSHSSDLSGQTILIVGGSSGIGLALAKELLTTHSPSTLIIASSQKSKVDDAIQFLSSSSSKTKLVGEIVDAKDRQTIRNLMSRVGEIDHLVWTSGKVVSMDFPKTDLDSDDIMGAFDFHFWGPLVAAQAGKFKDGGSITLTMGTSTQI